jgi:ABC-2 type transport system ATP-binding protein/lipopolysaccharide transport system ATP-binding protein
MASITLETVSVSFPVYSSATRSIKNRLIQSATGGQIRSDSGSDRISVVQALQDINLKLESGDRIGLVGHNGAGKSRLLRVLGGIYEPNEGRVSIQGSTVPLFDISLGMDPESTGYENILLRGLYLGLSRSQMRSRLDEIADFTELGDFLNLPIRTYSAGMRMRLAFAVSTSVAPDILLIDEGIGAGDAAFLEKASQRLKLFTEQVSIIVLSSHSEALISQMCTKAVSMEHGRVVGAGTTEAVLEQYKALRDGSPKAPPLEAAISRASAPRKAIAAVHREAGSEASAKERAVWADQTAHLLREHRWQEVDLDRLVREVESLADPNFEVIESQLSFLLLQVLTWYLRESERSELRRDLIGQVRRQIELMMEEDPTLTEASKTYLGTAYRRARAGAARHLDIELSQIPEELSIPLEKLLDVSWFPERVSAV